MLGLIFYGIVSLGIYGNVYQIKEENILEKVKQKVVRYDVEKRLSEFSKVNLSLPVNKKLEIVEEKLIYEVPKDVKIGDRFIARKGERINVLERIRLRKVYVFLEGDMLEAFCF